MSGMDPQVLHQLPVKCDKDYITLLARDPHWLYVYWEISENRKILFLKEFGIDFAEKSVPVLKITNISKNESFYVRINDFSNNWYIHVPDSNNLYMAEIGRRVSEDFFVSLLNSNSILAPGDSMSSDNTAYFINYTDLRNGKLDGGIMKTFDFQTVKQPPAGFFGTSSLEFAGQTDETSHFGESSAQLFGIKIQKKG